MTTARKRKGTERPGKKKFCESYRQDACDNEACKTNHGHSSDDCNSPLCQQEDSETKDGEQDGEHNMPATEEERHEEPLYWVRRMSWEASPHPRAKIEAAIAALSKEIRDKPTIPADPANPLLPWEAALREDAAIQLPPKHCAFKGCVRQGSTDEELQHHVVIGHHSAVHAAAQTLPSAFNRDECMYAVYAESVAEKCREGAPIARYSIERRSLYNYAKALAGTNICEPICFVCACTYPYISHRVEEKKYSDIRWVKPLQASQKETGRIASCFGMNWSETYDILGLDGCS